MKNSMKLMAMLTLALLFVGVAQAESIKVMTFNMWGGGDGWQQCAQQIQSSGADIIGIQEGGGSEMFADVADYLGFYSDYGTYTLSRWPIIEVQGYGFGQAVTICTPTGQEVYMFNCHLTAYPYPPYSLPDVAKALREEKRTQWSDLNPILANMASYIATGKPVFLSGDFNVCSHLDYDGIAWRCSTECAAAGLTDSYWEMNGPVGGHLWPPDWAYDDEGITWTPKPEQEPEGKFDRIDLVYYTGTGVYATSSTELGGANWPSDHRAVVSTITIPDGPGGDCGYVPPPPPSLSLNKSTYASGEAIVATFANGPGNTTDWISVYENHVTPGDVASFNWCYVDGTQQAGPTAPTDGSVTLDSGTVGAGGVWPIPEGNYDAYFLCCDGYSVLDGPIDFTVTSGGPTVDMYVNDIAMSWYEPKTGNYAARATVWIKDDGTPSQNVVGATVSGTWSGATSGGKSGTTGSDGKTTIESKSVKGGGTFTFTVTDVSATGYTYNPGLNVETSDSITAP